MSEKKSLRNTPFIHPLFIALYPVFSLWLANIDQVQMFAIVRPLILNAVLLVATLLVTLLLFRSARKATLFTSLLLVAFLFYGRVFQYFDNQSIGGLLIGRHRFFFPAWVALFAIAAFFLIRSRSRLDGLVTILNVVSVALVTVILVQALFFQLQPRPDAAKTAAAAQETARTAHTVPDSSAPDVYYIILDAYAREDVLASKHHLDTHAFIQQIKDLGFTVADCSQSNYVWTPLSLGSSLNMNYLDALGVPFHPDENRVNYWDFINLLHQSAVRQKFETMGYKTVTFKTVYPWLDITDSTEFIDVQKTSSFFDRQESVNFEYLYLRTTALRLLLEAQEKSPHSFDKLPPFLLQFVNPKAGLLSSRRTLQYQQNLSALESLSKLPEMPGPKFVYAHLFITHQPYVFHPDGSMRWEEIESMEAYNDQVVYADKRMIDILKKLIQDSKVPPIIVIQGDHGYVYDTDRDKILNAYYLPGSGAQKAYPTISPVNTFRVIFNTYFGENLPLLEDKSYYSTNLRPYQFQVIPQTCDVHNK